MEKLFKGLYGKKNKDISRIDNLFRGDDSFQKHFLDLQYSLDDFILSPTVRLEMKDEFLDAIRRAQEEEGQCTCTIS